MSAPRADHASARPGAQGQATIEFALAIIFILFSIFGGLDVARAVYTQHGLNRAAEAIAQSVAMGSSTSPQTPVCQLNLASLIASARKQANVTFASDAPSCLSVSCPAASGTTSQQITSTSGGVSITGVPDLCAPLQVRVTITGSFTPVTGFLLGGRSLTLSMTVTVQTAQALAQVSSFRLTWHAGEKGERA